MGVCDHSHAHGSRTRTKPDHTSHQPVTGQRSTALTVIFSRQPPSRLGQPTEPRGGHTRSLLRTAVGHCSLGHAHRPHGVGAGAGCALSRPSWAATLAHRPRSCGNQGHFLTPAASPVHEGDPMSSPRRLRHPRPCHCLRYLDEKSETVAGLPYSLWALLVTSWWLDWLVWLVRL